ncbi:hypothetical protein D7322_23390 [Sphingobacterium puteale]|uniref:Uncharacterized protein n=1 Tax=Sphingobacterium puteale TaxID=2420510 RepID=A0A420VS62_9SPHI|nr:hypothetical protein D7322_23390 [Sphingobacterium puteale]
MYLLKQKLSFFLALSSNTDNKQVSEAINVVAFLVDAPTPGEFLTGSVKGAIFILIKRGKEIV